MPVSLRHFCCQLALLSMLFSLLGAADIALGAPVLKKLASKSVVIIGGGENFDVKVGHEFCFYDDKTQLGCGKAVKVQLYRTFVKVPESLLSQITTDTIAASGKVPLSPEKSRPKNPVVSFSLGGFVTPYPLYRMNTPINELGEPPYWQSSEDSDHTYPGFYSLGHWRAGGLVGELKIHAVGLHLGGRYDFVKPRLFNWELPFTSAEERTKKGKDCEPDSGGETCYAVVNFEERSWGVWLQYLYGMNISKDLVFAFGGGLDMDVSNLGFHYIQVTSRKTSKNPFKNYVLIPKDTRFILYSLGVRLVPVRLTMRVSGSFGVFVEAAAVMGLWPLKNTITGNRVPGDYNIGFVDNQVEVSDNYITKYFAEALDHRPGFGAVAHVGWELSL